MFQPPGYRLFCSSLVPINFNIEMFSTQLLSVDSISGWGQVVGSLQKWVKDASLNPFMLRMMWNIYLFFSIVYKRKVTRIASFHYAFFFFFLNRNDPCSLFWKEWFRCINVAEDYFGIGWSNLRNNHYAAFLCCYLFSVSDYGLRSRHSYSLLIQSQPG